MPPYRRLEVRDCQGTLWAFYRQYEGRAKASFEGDLSGLNLHELNGVSNAEIGPLKRQTFEPTLDFMVVPIDHDTVHLLKKRLSAPGVLGRNGSVVHTQIAVDDDLVFVACDNFHDDCTVASLSVPEPFLKDMQSRGLLRAYSDT